MKKRIIRFISIGLIIIMTLLMVGCSSRQITTADIDPDTPFENVAFPLKEKAQLSFSTNAPGRTTQEPN